MKQKIKKNLFIIIILFGIILFLLSGQLFIEYYIAHQENECLNNPLVYGSKQLTDKYSYEFIGSGFFLTPINIRGPQIIFNSTDITILDTG